jgi:hypothetical protein
MAKNIIKSVATKGVGFGPILRFYFEKCNIAQIIDENVSLLPRRKVLTHIQASIAMIAGILFQAFQLYRLCKFASDRTILGVIFPGIAPEEYFYDRLADTLDAIFDYGIGNLETLVTQRMISEFNIENDLCHNDTRAAGN